MKQTADTVRDIFAQLHKKPFDESNQVLAHNFHIVVLQMPHRCKEWAEYDVQMGNILVSDYASHLCHRKGIKDIKRNDNSREVCDSQ